MTENIITLRSIKQWNNDENRTKYAQGNDVFGEIVRKRFKADGMKVFFGTGQDAEAKLDKFVDNCGGSLRHLLRMLNIAMLRVKEAPFTDSLIDGSISELENSFVISIDDARWLEKIAKTRSESLTNNETENVNKLTRLIDTHLVLYFRNGGDWYDIHPLVRKKVANIVAQNPPEPVPTQPQT